MQLIKKGLLPEWNEPTDKTLVDLLAQWDHADSEGLIYHPLAEPNRLHSPHILGRSRGVERHGTQGYYGLPIFGDRLLRVKLEELGLTEAHPDILARVLRGRFCIDFADQKVGYDPNVEFDLGRDSYRTVGTDNNYFSEVTALDIAEELVASGFTLHRSTEIFPEHGVTVTFEDALELDELKDL
jgi:hypothetical protein